MMHIANGERFPSVDAVIDGETVDLAEVGAGSWSVILFYRGHW